MLIFHATVVLIEKFIPWKSVVGRLYVERNTAMSGISRSLKILPGKPVGPPNNRPSGLNSRPPKNIMRAVVR
jgi:hypothetical protein